MLGSLYFSEVAHFVPCTLCWFQRIGVDSLVIILFVATCAPRPQHPGLRHHTGARGPPDLDLPLPGGAVPNLETNVCSTGLSCSIVWFRSLGFMSLAYMAES